MTIVAWAATSSWRTMGEALVLDVSAGGVKLSLDFQLRLHQVISVAMEAPHLRVNVNAPVEVRWLRPAENERWTAGCAFVPALSADTLESLRAAGLIERRTVPRQPISIAASAQWELDPCRFDVELKTCRREAFVSTHHERGRSAHGSSSTSKPRKVAN